MGNCKGCVQQNISIVHKRSIDLKTFHNEVLKCPEGHWLAFFQSSNCHNCLKYRIQKKSKISCISCSFALCEACFQKKFTKWETIINDIKPKLVKHLLNSLQEQKDQYFKNRQQDFDNKQIQNLLNFIRIHSLKDGYMRADENISVSDSLIMRTSKVISLCEKVYEKKLKKLERKQSIKQ